MTHVGCVVFFLACRSWRTTWGELGFFWLLRGEGAAGVCRLLTGLPSFLVASGAVVGVLCDLGVLAGRARGMVCETTQIGALCCQTRVNDTCASFSSFFYADTLEPSMANSCWLSRARVPESPRVYSQVTRQFITATCGHTHPD